MDMVRLVRDKGFLIGSCSDRTLSGQRALWAAHDIEVDFVVSKHMLPDVKAQFEADVYVHIGDREDLDRQYALAAGFEFLWPDEAVAHPHFQPEPLTGREAADLAGYRGSGMGSSQSMPHSEHHRLSQTSPAALWSPRSAWICPPHRQGRGKAVQQPPQDSSG